MRGRGDNALFLDGGLLLRVDSPDWSLKRRGGIIKTLSNGLSPLTQWHVPDPENGGPTNICRNLIRLTIIIKVICFFLPRDIGGNL